MKLIEELIQRAAAADHKAGTLADQAEASRERRKAYRQLEQLFERAAADGLLDRSEIDELMARFSAAGLTTKELEALRERLQLEDLATVEVDAELRNKIGAHFREAYEGTELDGHNFEVMTTMREYHQSIDLAARVQKAEHEIYMAAIRNLKA